MQNQTRTNRQVFDIPGTITGPDGLKVDVRFDLVEFVDVIDGVPGPKSSYGVLRFVLPLDPSVEARLLAATRLTLTGGGIQSALCLYQLNSFTLVDTMREYPGRLSVSMPSNVAAA